VRRQQSSHQSTVIASAESDGQVDALVYQIYKSITEGHIYGDLGPLAHELIHDWQYVQPAERDRQLQAQAATRRLRVTQHRHFRLVEIGEDVDAALEKYSALSRQRDAPCRSLQQAYAKPILEPHDAFAHRRPRQTDSFRRRGKAIRLGDVNKGVNVPHSFDCHWLARLGVLAG
jgi:hypothetical protein